MKNKFYLLNVIAVIVVITQSCTSKLTPVAGVGKSGINGPPPNSYDDPVGFQAGAVVPVANINEAMSIRVEANLTKQGARYEDDYFGSTYKGRVTLLYANLPLVLRYQIKSGFFGEAGIQPGFLLMAKDKYKIGTEEFNDDFKDSVKKIDFAIPIGVGYEFKNNFGVGIRVVQGLSNLNAEGSSINRNFFAVLRGTYTFDLK